MARLSYPETLDAAWLDHLAPRQPNAPTVVSLFAGCGGSSLGYSMAGYRELLAVEWDQNAVDTFRLNFPEVPVYHGDITKLSVDECLALAGVRPGELDVLDGSPPCQGFSTAGKRDMSDSRNQLFREYTRLLRGLRPRVFVMENVSGMVKGKMKLIFVEILRELKASGYRVSARLLNAMYFGVPQSRARMIFVGVREDVGMIPTHPRSLIQPIPLRAICPDAMASRSYSLNAWISRERPVCTITKVPYTRLLRLENGDTRAPSLEELRAFGSYPEGFHFIGDLRKAWERIGNSVPPLFMRAIAEHIRSEILRRAVSLQAAV